MFFTRWNFVLVSLFVTGCCFLIWLSRWTRGSCSDSARLGGIMLSMMVDHTTPAISSSMSSQPLTRSVPASQPPPPKRHRFTQKQRHYVASVHNYCCFLCGASFCQDLKDMDIDHILALESGGSDWPDLTNLSALCVPCHRRKTQLERQRRK